MLEKLKRIQTNRKYDFATISPCKVEIRGKIYTLSLRNWKVLDYLVANGTSDSIDIGEYIDCVLDAPTIHYIRKKINRVLRDTGSQYRITTGCGYFSISLTK